MTKRVSLALAVLITAASLVGAARGAAQDGGGTQQIRLRYGPAAPYRQETSVGVEAALLWRDHGSSEPVRLPGGAKAQLDTLRATLTNVELGCEPLVTRRSEGVPEEFSVSLSMIAPSVFIDDLYDEDALARGELTIEFHGGSLALADGRVTMEFPGCLLMLFHVNAPRPKKVAAEMPVGVYVGTTHRGNCTLVRTAQETRLIVEYKDKDLTVHGDVALTHCESGAQAVP